MYNEGQNTVEQMSVRDAVVLDLVFAGAEVSVEDILKKHQISTEKYAEWLGDDEYVAAIRNLSSRGAEAEMARVLKCLTHFAEDGNVPAAKAVDALLKDRTLIKASVGTDVEAVKAEFRRLDREILGVDEVI